jgi:hypothetical protein
MNIEIINNHIEQAKDRFVEQYKSTYYFNSLIESIIQPIQTLENETFNVYTKRWIKTAEGQQLDNLGKIIGEPRLGRSDEAYRSALIIKVYINTAFGQPESIINVIQEIYNADSVEYQQGQPASFQLHIISNSTINNINELVNSLIPAGVKCSIITQSSDNTGFILGANNVLSTSNYSINSNNDTLDTGSGNLLEVSNYSSGALNQNNGFGGVILNMYPYEVAEDNIYNIDGNNNTLDVRILNNTNDVRIIAGGKLGRIL